MVVRRDAFLAHPAVPSSERHVYQALGAVSERDLDFSSPVAPLHSGQIPSFKLVLGQSFGGVPKLIGQAHLVDYLLFK